MPPVSFRRLLLSLLLALGATAAHAQAARNPAAGTAVLPVVNNGQIEALLLLEPSPLPASPSDRIIRPAASRNLYFGNGLQLRAGLSIDANPGIGVLCDSASTVITTVGSLAGHCLLADLNATRPPLLPGRAAGALQLSRNGKSVSAALGADRSLVGGSLAMPGALSADQRLLDTLLGPGAAGIDARNASLVGQIDIGSQGWIRVGGTLARVRLIPTSQLPDGLPAEWNTSSFTVGAGTRRLGGEITGQVIEVPGQAQSFSTLGAGVTWRTPWRARVSVGAENLLTRGKNPFGLPDDRAAEEEEEGRVPYVRYQQDL
jgi:hypothetical protein